MKYIFRYALLTQFTQKEDLITKQQLVQALKTAKCNVSAKDLDNLINKHAQCISLLIKTSDKRDTETILKDSFDKEELTDNDIHDILTVWEAEKHLIYKKILNKNVKTAANYQGINWALRKGIATRTGTGTATPIVSLHLKDKDQTFKVSLTKTQFSQLSQSVKSGTQFFNELFQN